MDKQIETKINEIGTGLKDLVKGVNELESGSLFLAVGKNGNPIVKANGTYLVAHNNASKKSMALMKEVADFVEYEDMDATVGYEDLKGSEDKHDGRLFMLLTEDGDVFVKETKIKRKKKDGTTKTIIRKKVKIVHTPMKARRTLVSKRACSFAVFKKAE